MEMYVEDKKQKPIEKLGRYIILKPLGKGGMGQVYLAEDPFLQRRLAIKIITVNYLLDENTKEEYLKRFLLEARASARLSHPSIVAVFDAGQEEGMPWIAFEFVDGERLNDCIQRVGSLSIKKTISYALDIASALDHAHGFKIVHRDIKPANILIDKKSGIAKIADFGIVKALWLGLTQEGKTLGSPGYMSPEQINGFDLDGRSDLFSLGVTLYEMISGKHPFLRDTVAKTAYATINGDYVALNKLVKQIPPVIDTIITQCLSIDREKRIGSAKKLIKLLKSAEVSPIQQSNQPQNVSTKHTTEGSIIPSVVMAKKEVQKALDNIIYRAKKSLQLFADHLQIVYSRVSKFLQKKISQADFTLKKDNYKEYFSFAIQGCKNCITKTQQMITNTYRTFYQEKKKKRIIATGIAAVSLILILIISSFLIQTISHNYNIKRESKTKSQQALKESGVLSIPIRNEPLVDSCKLFLKNNNLTEAKRVARKLTQSKSVPAYGYIFLGRTAIRRGNYTSAAEAFESAKKLKRGKSILKKELNSIMGDLKTELKKNKAPQSLIYLVVITLSAADEPIVREWVGDTQYWLRWNAVKIAQAESIEVDMVNVYILDLKYAGSSRTRINAAKQLGKLCDNRAVPALKEAENRGIRDPFVAGAAGSVLDQHFR